MFTADKTIGYVTGKRMAGVPALVASAKSMLGPRSSSISSTCADNEAMSTQTSMQASFHMHQVTAAMESDDAATESSYMSEVYGTDEEEEENNAMPASDEMEYEHLEQGHVSSTLQRSDTMNATLLSRCHLLPTVHTARGDCLSFSKPIQARLAQTGSDLLETGKWRCLQQKLANTRLSLLLEEQVSGSSSVNSIPCTPPSTPFTPQRQLDYEQQQQRFMQELQLHAKTWQLLEEETLGPSDL